MSSHEEVLLPLSISGFILSTILLLFNGRKFPSAFFLGGFFLLISFYGIVQYILIFSKSVLLISIFYLNFSFFWYLIGPMLYWYIRSILKDNPRLTKKDLWHLIIPVLILINTFPHLFSSFSHKKEIAAKIIEDTNSIGLLNATFLNGPFALKAIYLSRPLLVIGYTILSAFLLIKFLMKKRRTSVLLYQQNMTGYLAILLGFLFMLSVSYFHFMLEAINIKDLRLFAANDFLKVLSGIGLTGLLVSPFFFPNILYGLPRFPEIHHAPNSDTNSMNIKSPGAKKYSPSFENDYLDFIGQKTDACMTEFKPYLQHDCNLSSFAKLAEIPAHHLAYYFRTVKKQPFNDYRNSYRVNHAKNLMKDGKSKELTLEAIGILSGFSSRKTFLNDFKKFEKISPSDYLHQH